MSVTITTQFWQLGADNPDDPGSWTPTTPDWSNLSNIVFTSPNIPSPNNAGTRSHILPGELPLGLWYEDTGDQYRITIEQEATDTSFDTTVSGMANNAFVPRHCIAFEVTSGDCYDCRLTAWDDVTHTTTDNYIIDTARVKCSAIAFRATGTKEDPILTVSGTGTGGTYEYVFEPRYNFTLKGNTVSGTDPNYYGDFNMIYAPPTKSKNGDYVMFKPWLDQIDATVPYGEYDFYITFHYTFTS